RKVRARAGRCIRCHRFVANPGAYTFAAKPTKHREAGEQARLCAAGLCGSEKALRFLRGPWAPDSRSAKLGNASTARQRA
ncbi:unnamed protein product, partial [Symbiodinium sp. CCMP2592]